MQDDYCDGEEDAAQVKDTIPSAEEAVAISSEAIPRKIKRMVADTKQRIAAKIRIAAAKGETMAVLKFDCWGESWEQLKAELEGLGYTCQTELLVGYKEFRVTWHKTNNKE